MRRLRSLLPFLAALLLLVPLFFFLLYFTDRDDETAQVILPPPVAPDGGADSNSGAGEHLTVARVTPETVLEVLRELKRADSYARELMVETIWADGSAAETLAVWASGSALRVESGGRNLLLADGKLWLWYNDDDRVLYREQDARAQADRYQRMLTYEELLSGEHDIEAADYVDLGGEPCIFVAYRDGGAFGYRNELYISVESGLLLSAETFDGDKCVYRMSSGPVDLSTPDEEILSPPNGAYTTDAPAP